jgi:hypothetical protein
MARYCIVPGCNTRLKTGRKYCWKHRGYKEEGYSLEDWTSKDFKPSNHYWVWMSLTIVLGLLAIYTIIRLEFEAFLFYAISALICYVLAKFSKRRFKKLLKEYSKNPKEYNKKIGYKKYKSYKRFNKPLFSNKKSTKLGRPMNVSAQSGMEGLYQTLR